MSTTKTTKTADDRVEVNIPRGGDREDPNLFVAVNGVNYLLPRGKKSRVPKAVADEIARAERARESLPLRYNKDKRKKPVFSRVSAFVVAYSIPFPTLIVNEKSVE